MDFFNQSINQLRELLMSMTPAARVTAFLLIGVIVVSLGYLVQFKPPGADAYLFNGDALSADDSQRAFTAIAQAGLTGAERVGNQIKVPRGRKEEFLAAVADAGALPTNFHRILEDALDDGAFVNQETRKQRLKAAREHQLSMLISNMDGIDEAQVIFDVQDPIGLAREGIATATVSVRPLDAGLDPRQAKMIRKAVAGAIAGLKQDNVIVTDQTNGSLYANDEFSSASFDDPYFQNLVTYEHLMEAKIRRLLQYIPGVSVKVSAELDDTLDVTTQTMTPEGEAAAVREMEQSDNSTTAQVNPGGRVGLTAQGPTRNNEQTAETTVTQRNEISSNTTEYLPGTRKEVRRATGMIPQRVRASIAVPRSYVINLWREQLEERGEDPNQAPSEGPNTALANLEKTARETIISSVAQLLPKEDAKLAEADVNVAFFETLSPKAIEPIPASSKMLTWAKQNFNTITMALVALFSLVMLRSMVKSVPPSDPISGFDGKTLGLDLVSHEATPAPTQEEVETAAPRPRLKLKKGDNLRDDLTQIVREDPDTAAAILRSWIGNAG